MAKSEADYLFEVSWEVCNKVGGIYTVVKSKAAQMIENYKNYYMIGPYFENNAKVDFIPLPLPESFKQAFETLKKQGIICHYGKWVDVKGDPGTILIDFKALIPKKNDIKKKYWDDYKIDSLRGYWDVEEPMLWSYCSGRLIEELSKSLDGKIVAHFHEWLSAFGLLYVKKYCKNIATVFTTHATTLGRTLAGNGWDLYAVLNKIDPDHEAYAYGVEAKHLTEKAASKITDVFTTVSEITAMEAEFFLGRKPEILVLNGLDIGKFPTIEETSIKHVTCRDKIREFLTYYFYPYYSFDFDIEHTLIFFIVGRFEFRNKGFDVMIDSLGRLNEQMKKERETNAIPDDKRTICVFFWTPQNHTGLNVEILENKNYYMHIKNHINWNAPDILKKLIYSFITSQNTSKENVFSEEFLREIKKDMVMFERKGTPPLSTHALKDEKNNLLANSLKQHGLLNRQEDVVKVIIQPIYLDGNDGFINLSYYDAMAGCHLGLFPSYYEPWGYTPLESAALGVPSLTTDLSGFGMFLKSANQANKGIFVLDRLNKNENNVINDFTKIMYDFARLDHASRVECKLSAKRISAIADWKIFVQNYVDAHNLALKKIQNK